MTVAPATPALTRCRVDVRANRIRLIRNLDDLAAKATPARLRRPGRAVPIYHLYIVYTDPLGRASFYRGGPENHRPPFGLIVTEHGPYVAGTIDWATDAITVTLAEGEAATGLDVCFRAELDRIEGLRVPYNLRGPNSNTVVRTMLERCGLPVAQPVAYAPGFDDTSLL
jgi:hypothetical protein